MGIENLFLLGNNHSNTEFKRIEQILHEVKNMMFLISLLEYLH
ncbi:hypothetical protein ACOT6T_07155 [Clostridium perfringens]|nr:hypothetical protein [Clostridium perfringens]MDK0790147.1 hypothetical protein [Clostridium perfringens]